MVNSDLATMLAVRCGLTREQALATVEAIWESMGAALLGGENIEIRGLGAFRVRQYRGYTGRNPKTGAEIPARTRSGVVFRAGKEVRDRLNAKSSVEPVAGSSG